MKTNIFKWILYTSPVWLFLQCAATSGLDYKTLTSYKADKGLQTSEWDICNKSPELCLTTQARREITENEQTEARDTLQPLFEVRKGEWGHYYTDADFNKFIFVPGRKDDAKLDLSPLNPRCPKTDQSSGRNWELTEGETDDETNWGYRGYKDQDGNWFKLQPPYEYANNIYSFSQQPYFQPSNYHNFSEGRLAVQIRRKWGYADEGGNIVIPPIFEELSFLKGSKNFRCGMVVLIFEQQQGIADIDGNWLVDLGQIDFEIDVSIEPDGLIDIFVPANYWDSETN